VLRIFGVALIVAGTLALVYGGFSYTSETHRAEVGSLVFSLHDTHTIGVPVWAGVAAILVGVVLVVSGARKG
jgi:TRAP-type C4-dicarboxylate transport system permease small subunit